MYDWNSLIEENDYVLWNQYGKNHDYFKGLLKLDSGCGVGGGGGAENGHFGSFGFSFLRWKISKVIFQEKKIKRGGGENSQDSNQI